MTRGARSVRVEAPAGRTYEFLVSGDATAAVLVDGAAVLGVDAHGAGHWPDGEVWRRVPGQVVERSATVLDMTEEQFHALLAHLGLPPGWWGRWKGGPGETRRLGLSTEEWSCGNQTRLDVALTWVRAQGLAYEETTTVRYTPAG
ncbi:hypothetical protein ACFFX1_49340 [Dactylosporangium sucinum]|uniref:Uncharacterized protein n=1 Tax=Dactylosporangium sucinum TaxID=1424081 RepID=A0A917UH43_9ACTN|nr:hypothetical protein [Dactylosporangium sucinum]GGM90053.1 hypothetical protein GCM10007977_110140 [Dactylosporangium sucinum]